MKIVPMEQLGREKWDAFVAASDQAWFYHLYDLIKAKAYWPQHVNDSFAVLDDMDHVQAVMPIHRICGKRKKILPWDILNSLGGLAVCNNAVGTKNEEKIWAFCLAHIMGSSSHKNIQFFETWLSPMAPILRGENCPIVSPLVLRGMHNTLTQTWVADLKFTEAELHMRLAKGFRESLKKADKVGVKVLEARPSREHLDLYYNLHRETCARSSIAPHPYDYFAHIWGTLLPNGSCRVLFAIYNDEVVSAINYAVNKGAGAYWTGASSQQALDLCANHVLHWNMLRTLKAQGCEWAEIGEAIFRSENEKHKSISDFKSRMGGRLYPYYKGMLSRKELSLYAGG